MLHSRFAFAAIMLAVGLFFAMLLFIELGRRIGRRHATKRAADAPAANIVGDSVVYALLALLIGFTFNGAAARFDDRRQLIVQTVSAMSTAWQRIDALTADDQGPIRAEFRRYVDAVVAPQTAQPRTRGEALVPAEELTHAQNSLWTRAMAACLLPTGERARMLLLPALNEMFDAVDKEHLVRRIHPPTAIYIMLGVAALAGALFVGYGMAAAPRRNWLYIIGVAATIASATYVVIDLEYPRLGLIRVDDMDQALVALRATMN